MNDKEKESVDKLRHEAGHHGHDLTDFDMLRWLRGYDYKFHEILPKLKEHVDFVRAFRQYVDFGNHNKNSEHVDRRTNNKIDYVPPEVMYRYWPRGLLAESGKNDDNLVYIECLGKTDGVGLLKSISVSDITKFVFVERVQKVFDKMRQKEAETGRIWALTHIVDLDGLIMDSKRLSVLTGPYKTLALFCLRHSVEMNKKIIWVNVPTFIHWLFQIVRRFLPEKTGNKCIILGPNWKQEILDHVEPSQLPVHWGGTMEDPVTGDSYCSSMVTVPPGPVDPKYFLQNTTEFVPFDINMAAKHFNHLHVPPWKSDFVEVHVDVAGSSMSWQFWTDGDFGFGVFYAGPTPPEKTTKEGNAECNGHEKDWRHRFPSAFPYFERIVGPTEVPEKDKILCRKSGLYRLYFNNEQSWFTSLNVYYKITVASM